MKLALLATSVLVLGSAPAALAADLPQRAAPAAYAPVPAFTWTGFFVGLNAGVGLNGDKHRFTPVEFPEVVTVFAPTGDDAGFTGGVQVGFNWQIGALVAGLEADINYISSDHDRVAVPAGAPLPYAIVPDLSGGTWFATVRPRLGVAFDRVLIYATGGVAFGPERDEDPIQFFNSAPPGRLNCLNGCNFVASDNGTEVGWTLGGGIEYAFAEKVSVKLEYLHVDFGRDSRIYRPPVPAAPHFIARSNHQFDVVRAGLNLRF